MIFIVVAVARVRESHERLRRILSYRVTPFGGGNGPKVQEAAARSYRVALGLPA